MMSGPTEIEELGDGSVTTPPAPGFTLTPDDPLAAKLAALHTELRAHKLAACHVLLSELIAIADDQPRANREETKRHFDHSVDMACWYQRYRTESVPEDVPHTGDLQTDLRRSALDRLIRTGSCQLSDLVSIYGFPVAKVFAYGASAITEARAKYEAMQDSGEAA